MKATYSSPKIEIHIIPTSQVITTSGDTSIIIPEDDRTVGLPFDPFKK